MQDDNHGIYSFNTMYIQVHTFYIGSTYGMHIPLCYVPLCSRMNGSIRSEVSFQTAKVEVNTKDLDIVSEVKGWLMPIEI